MTNRVALVSCVKSKRNSETPARDMYTSSLFTKMRRYAEQHAEAWFILSAEHGVLAPDELVAPYEKTLNKMIKAERLVWAERVQQQIIQVLLPGTKVIFLAGKRYREDIVPFLTSKGFSVEVPMQGLAIGSQLSWLNRYTHK
jgi:cytoplasmic iron level regulating protein YaaA (DUF328/UPF0246 family)